MEPDKLSRSPELRRAIPGLGVSVMLTNNAGDERLFCALLWPQRLNDRVERRRTFELLDLPAVNPSEHVSGPTTTSVSTSRHAAYHEQRHKPEATEAATEATKTRESVPKRI